MRRFENLVSREFKRIWDSYKTIIILGFIFIPFVLQIASKAFNDLSEYFQLDLHFGLSSTSLSFWGSYLGIIPSGLIAYAVARYQIDNDRERDDNNKIMKSLPYFDINSVGDQRWSGINIRPVVSMLTSTLSPELPLRSIQFRIFTRSKNNLDICTSSPINNMGHRMPEDLGLLKSKQFDVSDKGMWEFERIDISLRLINGHSIFYTYGDGLIGHLMKNDVSKEIKLYDGVEKDKQKIIDRWNDFDKAVQNETDE